MKDSSSLCLSCGLCCDGTVIGFVQLDKEEIPAIRKLKTIEEEQGHGFFLQPCDSFCDGCTIYSGRPKQCGIFKCGLLKSLELTEVEFDTAVEMIEAVKSNKVLLEEKLAIHKFELHSKSFYFQMIELKNLLESNKIKSTISTQQEEMLSDLLQFDVLLFKNLGVSLFQS
jgi:Fe-S-cluster containining protein